MNATRIGPLRRREPRSEAQFAAESDTLLDTTRSESVGADWEPSRLDAEGRTQVRWLFVGIVLVLALILAAHFAIRFVEM